MALATARALQFLQSRAIPAHDPDCSGDGRFDVKTANVLIFASLAKLCDFGRGPAA